MAAMSTTIEKPREAGPDSGLGGAWRVIVRNDNHNTFDHVAETLARVSATWSKVLWLSLRTITRQAPPRPESGPASRGFSIVVDIAAIMRRLALERAWDPHDYIVEAAERALGVADRAQPEARAAALQLAGGPVGDVGDELATDEGEDAATALVGAAGDVEGAQAQLVGLVEAVRPDAALDLHIFDLAVGPHPAQLCLALQREEGELVAGAGAACAQVERQEGPALDRFRGALEQPPGHRHFEVAADHRGAVGAFPGAFADEDAESAVRAAAGAALAVELDDLGAQPGRLHAVAVDADHRGCLL